MRGEPVASGTISFDPVEPGVGGGFAFIVDGAYDTADGGRGHLGGEHLVRITGDTGELINPDNPDLGTVLLFPTYETTLDLPARHDRRDFDIPAAALQNMRRSVLPLTIICEEKSIMRCFGLAFGLACVVGFCGLSAGAEARHVIVFQQEGTSEK